MPYPEASARTLASSLRGFGAAEGRRDGARGQQAATRTRKEDASVLAESSMVYCVQIKCFR